MTPEMLADLHRQVFKTPRPWSIIEFQDLLAKDNILFLHRDSGFAIARVAGPEVELLTLAVAPKSQRLGIGKSLLREVILSAQRRGAEEVILEVSDQNTAAKALYLAEGFTTVGHRKDYYQAPTGARITAIVMKITLKQNKQ